MISRVIFLVLFLVVTIDYCRSESAVASTSSPQVRTMTTSTDIKIVFSDVDGTLAHYPEKVDEHVGTEENKIILLPPSATGMQGIISSETLRKCQELRQKGKKLVLVSGMRSSTLWKRIPYLPRADAYCCEAGGRVFYPKRVGGGTSFQLEPFDGATEATLEPFELEEDKEWRQQMSKTVGLDGFVGNELDGSSSGAKSVAVDKRSGLLWEYCLELQKKGFIVDIKAYSTCFRVNRKQQSSVSESEFAALHSVDAPTGLATSINLGCVDFYPFDSGKKNCCQYVARKLCGAEAVLSENAVCLCDDDNDLEMALACKHAFVPGISSASMAQVVENNTDRITATGGINELEEGTVATERALDAVLEMMF